MPDSEPKNRAPAAASGGAGGDYPSRVRRLLGIPARGLVVRALPLPPFPEPLPPAFPAVHTPHADPPRLDGGAGVEAAAEPAPSEAPPRSETMAFPEEEHATPAAQPSSVDSAPAPELSRVDADVCAPPERAPRDRTAPDAGRTVAEESATGRVGPEREPHGERRPDRAPLHGIDERLPTVEVPGAGTRGADTAAAMPLEHVRITVPGGRAETEKTRDVAPRPPEAAAFPADAGRGRETADGGHLNEVAPPTRSGTMAAGRGGGVAGAGTAGRAWASTRASRAPVPFARAPAGTAPPGASRQALPAQAAGEARDWGVQERQGGWPVHLRTLRAHAEGGVGEAAKRAGDGAAAAPTVDGMGAEPFVSAGLRPHTVEDLVQVPLRDHPGAAQLEKRLERLESQLDRQRRGRPQAARAEPAAAPRVVFVPGRPAATPGPPRAYWERVHLGRLGLGPRR